MTKMFTVQNQPTTTRSLSSNLMIFFYQVQLHHQKEEVMKYLLEFVILLTNFLFVSMDYNHITMLRNVKTSLVN